MNVSIIIVNYNTSNDVLTCVDSIYRKTTGISYEIIVVDNNSSVEKQQILEGDSRFIFVKSPSNLGFGRANNLGLKYAHGDYVLLLNPDTYLLNNAIKMFFDASKTVEEDIAFIGCHLLAKDEKTKNVSGGHFPTVGTMLSELFHIVTRKSSSSKKEIEYITGADLFFKKSLVDRYGLFDSAFFMYFEETEMQLRYHRLGYKCKLIEGPRIVHTECVTTKKGHRHTAQHWILYFNGYRTYINKTKKAYIGSCKGWCCSCIFPSCCITIMLLRRK